MSRRTVEEQAAEWRTSPRSVLAAIGRKELRATKIAGRWLIDPSDAEAYELARVNVVPIVKRTRRPQPRGRAS